MRLSIIFKHVLIFSLICASEIVHSDSISKKIFDDYRLVNNFSFSTGDTTHLRKLFSGDTEACWVRDNINYSAPLISESIPENASFTLTEIDIEEYETYLNYGLLFQSKPTHKLDISHKKTYFSTCANREKVEKTGVSVFVTVSNNNYTIPAICPSKSFLESKAKERGPSKSTELSLQFIRAVLKNLSDDEKITIKNSEKSLSDRKKYLNKTNAITQKYKLSPVASRIIGFELCKKAH